jgi:hypothetical protein
VFSSASAASSSTHTTDALTIASRVCTTLAYHSLLVVSESYALIFGVDADALRELGTLEDMEQEAKWLTGFLRQRDDGRNENSVVLVHRNVILGK